ncbi:MAG: hypothetical protein CK519_01990 [Opitutia bacterium]|nr:MAG: hypothetical protein CK519_01990 [Opitutae bacterium]
MKLLPISLMVLSLTGYADEKVKPATPAPATPAPTALAPEAPKTVQVEILDSNGKKFILVKSIESVEEFAAFEKDAQAITADQKDAALTKQLLDLALTTPEKEARTRELDGKFKKLQATNDTMAKTYNFDLTRQYLIVPTSVKVLTIVTNEEYTKLAAAKDFKPDSVVAGPDDKKLILKETVKGAAEVEAFQQQVRRVLEAKRGLQQLVEAQPRFTKAEDKNKIEEAIKNTQAEVNKSLEDFKKSRGYEIPNEFNVQTAQAKLYTLLSDEEQKNLQSQIEGKDAKPEAKADKK